MAVTSAKEELATTLLDQSFDGSKHRDKQLSEYKLLAEASVKIDNSIAVLSDLQNDRSYIYAGDFGKIFGISQSSFSIESAFEDCIFNKIHPDDLTGRHILEIRYFQLLKNLPVNERRKYNTFSYIRVNKTQDIYMYITHRTFFLASLANGSIWLSLCHYAPSIEQHPRQTFEGRIINNETGEVLPAEKFKQYDKTLLSSRELEVLACVAKGEGSKQIAEKLHIAVYTVHRHRQNILKKMNASNAAEAVNIAAAMGLIII